jgi:hypothetical protein
MMRVDGSDNGGADLLTWLMFGAKSLDVEVSTNGPSFCVVCICGSQKARVWQWSLAPFSA